MPPVCTLDVPALGVVVILQPGRHPVTGDIMQPVHTNLGVIDKTMLREIERATYILDDPLPTVECGQEEGVIVFGFNPETVAEKTVPGLLKLIFDEHATRAARHEQFNLTGPSIAAYSELKVHG